MFLKNSDVKLLKFFNVRCFTTLLTLCLLLMGVPSFGIAHEMLRIASMGGARVATAADDAGIFGNPASLVSVKPHNLAFGVASEDLHWAALSKQGREQFAAEVNADVYLSVYYSHAFRGWGMSVGYAVRFANAANFTIEATRAEYNKNRRQFNAITDLITDYDLHYQRNWVMGVSRAFGKSVAGVRLKWVDQRVNRGTTISTLNLAARHGPEVDATVPEVLIPETVEALQFGDRVREIVHMQHPTLDRRVGGLEVDIGFQREVWLNAHRTIPPLQVGVLFENVLRAALVEPLPFQLGIGVAYEPVAWLRVAADVSRGIGQHPIDYAIGTEFQKTWRNDYAVALRIGMRHIQTPTDFTAGIALMLGRLSTEYTLSRPLKVLPIREAYHLLALTLRL